jgi:hypothetical protein
MTRLSGRVPETGTAISGATVAIIDTQGTDDTTQWSIVASDTTDANGEWSVSGLEPSAVERYHAVAQFDSGVEFVNFESLPYLSTPADAFAPTTPVNVGTPTASVSVGIPDSALTQDLIAWYRFEDGDARDYTNDLDAQFADTTAYDGTVDGATFQSSAGVTDFENGANSGAFDFDGSNDSITLPSIPFGAGNSGLTMMAYERFTGSGFSGIFALNGQRNIFIERVDSSNIRFFLRDSSGNDFSDDISVPSNQYNHVVLSYTPTSYDIFVNGSFITTISGYNGLKTDFGTNLIGGVDFEAGINNEFQGRIDDVRLYNRALTASEISDIYNATEP